MGALALLGAGLLGYALWIEPYWIEVSRHTLAPLGPAPDTTQGAAASVAPLGTTVSVLHLTDLHVVRFGGRERHVLELARQLAPDLIVVTGDVVSSPSSAESRAASLEMLRALVALAPPLGIYACEGNHEDWNGEPALELFQRAGLPVLSGQDSVSRLGGRLVVHGVPGARAPLPPTTAGLDLLLCHYPVVLPRAAAAGFELVLAGHTHGGQVQLPAVGPLWLPFDSGEYVEGWFQEGRTRMYVSRGVGTSMLPIRFLARPEVALIELRLPAATE